MLSLDFFLSFLVTFLELKRISCLHFPTAISSKRTLKSCGYMAGIKLVKVFTETVNNRQSRFGSPIFSVNFTNRKNPAKPNYHMSRSSSFKLAGFNHYEKKKFPPNEKIIKI